MTDDQGGIAWPIIKLGLLGLGGLVALGFVVSVLKPLLLIGVLAGVGYAGYRLYAGSKRALGSGEDRKALSADADFERRMRELDAVDRQLDAKIRDRS